MRFSARLYKTGRVLIIMARTVLAVNSYFSNDIFMTLFVVLVCNMLVILLLNIVVTIEYAFGVIVISSIHSSYVGRLFVSNMFNF